MNETPFASLARRANASTCRRGSLMALGGAGLAALAAPALAAKSKKTAKRRARTMCQRQVDECRATLTARCDRDPRCPVALLPEILACCDLLKDCQAGAAVTCLLAPRETPDNDVR